MLGFALLADGAEILLDWFFGIGSIVNFLSYFTIFPILWLAFAVKGVSLTSGKRSGQRLSATLLCLGLEGIPLADTFAWGWTALVISGSVIAWSEDKETQASQSEEKTARLAQETREQQELEERQAQEAAEAAQIARVIEAQERFGRNSVGTEVRARAA